MKFLFYIFFTLLLSTYQSASSQTIVPVELSSKKILDNTQIASASGVVKHASVTKVVDAEVPFTERHYDNLWLKLAEGFEFEIPDNPRITAQRNYYLKHPTYLQRISKRAEPFLWLIVDQIENNNLPLELALIPIVESAFDPSASSSTGASGLWQFMPSSGLHFGLQQNGWYDGRKDVYASTRGALNYMQTLHNSLSDDWLYAFAAYNYGEGRVKRAIRKNKKAGKPTDYWHLSLPKETQKYVPKFLALVDILRNHKAYGIALPYISNTQVLTYVDIGSQVDLAYVAELADLTVPEIKLLNPAFNHEKTSPEGPHRFLLPKAIAKQFSNKLAKIDKNHPHIPWDRYLVSSGDSLSIIAQKNQTTTRMLKQINNLDSSLIKVGQTLLIPIATKEQQQNLALQIKPYGKIPPTNTAKTKKVIHKVVKGDTLWDISKKYKVTSKQIAKWNGFNVKKTLRLGEELTIWKTVPTLAIN